MLNVTFCDKASFRLTHAYPPFWSAMRGAGWLRLGRA